MSLFKFIDWWNSERPCFGSNKYADQVGEEVKQSYLRQFVQRNPRPIGLSQIGKPLVELIYQAVIDPTEEDLECGLRYIFHIGDVTETLLIAMMQSFGLDVHSKQLEVEYKGVYGHIDCMVDDRLIEIKSMSHTYWTQFVGCVDDERGYITQLALYTKAVQTQRKVGSAGWLVLNKSTGALRYVKLPTNLVKSTLVKAAAKIKKFDKALSELDATSEPPLSWIRNNVRPPDPICEKKNKVMTGKLLIPPNMKLAASKYTAYPTEDGIYVDREEFERIWGSLQ